MRLIIADSVGERLPDITARGQIAPFSACSRRISSKQMPRNLASGDGLESDP
jgi:hypothetical protein